MNKTSKVIYLEKCENLPPVRAGRYSEAAATCRGILFQTLTRLMGELFIQVDDDLYHLAENSSSNARQTLFFDAMRSVRLMQKQVERNFLQLIEDGFQIFWSGGEILSASMKEVEEEAGFSLVEKDELEEELAITTMASKADGFYHRELLALNRRFAHMLGRESLDTDASPVSPAMLAMSFRQALADWESEVLARIVVYKCFDKVVLSRMKACYASINQYLAEQGVLPDLRLYGAPHEQPGSSGSLSTGDDDPAEGEDTGGAFESQPAQSSLSTTEEAPAPTLAELWQYIQQSAAAAAPAQGASVNANLPVVSRTNVMQTLTRMQGTVAEYLEHEQSDRASLQAYIRRQLEQTLIQDENGQPLQRMGEAEQQIIDVILMLFDHVLEDPNLPDAMRALIARLQIPVLKTAIADPTFVDDKDHPARRLVDDLAAACVGWRDEGDRSENTLYGQVKRVVERIVHEYRDDIGLFVELHEQFMQYMEDRARRKQLVEQRLAEVVSGEERLEVAQLKVDEVFSTFGMDSLPEAAQGILQGPWKKLMTILWLREGEAGDNWNKAVKIAEMLGKYLCGSASGYSREELLASIPEILAGLKKGFAYISLDQKKSTVMLNRLQTCFIQALRPQAHRPGQAEDTVEKQPTSGQPEQDAAEARDEYDEKVAAIEDGDWIRLVQAGEQEPLICKLVWRSEYTGTMVFVDGQGNKAAQLKEDELAQRFRDGDADYLEDAQAPLIDRAIKKMMKVLNARIVGPRLQMAE